MDYIEYRNSTNPITDANAFIIYIYCCMSFLIAYNYRIKRTKNKKNDTINRR